MADPDYFQGFCKTRKKCQSTSELCVIRSLRRVTQFICVSIVHPFRIPSTKEIISFASEIFEKGGAGRRIFNFIFFLLNSLLKFHEEEFDGDILFVSIFLRQDNEPSFVYNTIECNRKVQNISLS